MSLRLCLFNQIDLLIPELLADVEIDVKNAKYAGFSQLIPVHFLAHWCKNDYQRLLKPRQADSSSLSADFSAISLCQAYYYCFSGCRLVYFNCFVGVLFILGWICLILGYTATVSSNFSCFLPAGVCCIGTIY